MSVQEGCRLGCISLLNVLEGSVCHYLVVKNNKKKSHLNQVSEKRLSHLVREHIRMLASSQLATRVKWGLHTGCEQLSLRHIIYM